jgi:hypothetical protein
MPIFICPNENCVKQFTRQSNLKRHFENFHVNAGNVVEKCFLCGQIFKDCTDLQNHYQRSHRPSRKFFIVESAFRKSVVTYRYNFLENEINFAAAQLGIKNLVKQQILFEAAKKTVCKVSLIFVAQMSMADTAGEKITTASIPFRAPAFLANASMPNNISKNIIKSFNHQAQNMEDFMQSGSNWQFDRGLVFHIEIAALRPILAGSDSTEINLKEFNNNKFLFNPSNRNKKCFLYCIAYHLFGNELKNLEEKKLNLILKSKINMFNTKKLSFPISIRGVKQFMDLNPNLDLKINILFREVFQGKEKIYPYEFGLGNGSNIVNILMVQRKSNSDSAENHFILISDVDKYLRKKYTNSSNEKSYGKDFFCLNCLNSFSSKFLVEEHEKICTTNKPRLEVMPKEEKSKIKFKHFEHQHKLDYIAYLDFECVLPNQKNHCVICRSLKCKCDASFTDVLSKQEPIGYSFVVLGPSDKIIHQDSYIGKDAGEAFVDHLLKQEQLWIRNLLGVTKDMVMTQIDRYKHEKSQNCYICNRTFNNEIYKVRDHNHLTGQYLGAACNSCNLRRRKPSTLRIFVHNGSR